MSGVSAAIITLNEADRMPDLLQSLAWADEVVVVDGGSTDSTVKLARDFGARVAVHPFDNFAAQRNRAIDLARGSWVLSIDADERPTPRLVSEIRWRVQSGRHAGFRVPIRSEIFGHKMRYGGTQDDRPVRLFRRDAARWTGEVHERLSVRGRIGELRHHLQHVTIEDLSAFLRKMHRYTSLAAERLVEAGQPPRWKDAWLRPPLEVFRRLIWKQGLLDGPYGWMFCLLSGLSEWVQAQRHRKLWEARRPSDNKLPACESITGAAQLPPAISSAPAASALLPTAASAGLRPYPVPQA